MRRGGGSWVAALALAACGGGALSPPPTPQVDAGADAQDAQDVDARMMPPDGAGGGLIPPRGGSSGGSGGAAPLSGQLEQAGSISYRLIVPGSYAGAPTPFLIVYSGTEGGAQMTQNLIAVGPQTGTDGFIRAVLDGVQYRDDGAAGAAVLDDVRMHYNIANDQSYLLGESAGTTAAESLGFHLRESWFAAYWANDVNAADGPAQTAAQIGFAPWGQVGPGGQFALAEQIVSAMRAAGYQLPNPAPYNGAGADQHGSPDQFLAAVAWFVGKSR
ncbi:MAG TPA: hypothetical protein VKN99_03740 [Polyangia bacterium]|nr:hypothetical protein [Polyangia bacterium]